MQLLSLPTELLVSIPSYLDESDVKALRLTCKKLHDAFELRIERVFLSANPRNVEVFLAIAAHEKLRHFVTEIIWDDAVFASLPWDEADTVEPKAKEYQFDWFDMNAHRRKVDVEEQWRNGNKQDDKGPVGDGEAQNSYEYYKSLVRAQNELRQSGRHVDALYTGVSRFTALRRITVTADSHGGVFVPRYPSPMVREFPDGFMYPFPHRWTLQALAKGINKDRLSEAWFTLTEAEKNMFQGVRTVFKLLASQAQGASQVSELILDAGILPTGMTHRIFEGPCDELHDFTAIVSRPGFRRLDLAIAVEGTFHHEGQSPLFRSGHFRETLSRATDLEHFRLQTSAIWVQPYKAQITSIPDDQIPPLVQVFPVECWPRLRHFGISGMCVRIEDILALFEAMPPTLRSIELDRLQFRTGKGSYGELLADAKYKLGWSRRQKPDRIRLTICTCHPRDLYGPFVRVCDEIGEYIYQEGSSPFQGNEYVGNQPPSMVKHELRFPLDKHHRDAEPVEFDQEVVPQYPFF